MKLLKGMIDAPTPNPRPGGGYKLLATLVVMGRFITAFHANYRQFFFFFQRRVPRTPLSFMPR